MNISGALEIRKRSRVFDDELEILPGIEAHANAPRMRHVLDGGMNPLRTALNERLIVDQASPSDIFDYFHADNLVFAGPGVVTLL